MWASGRCCAEVGTLNYHQKLFSGEQRYDNK
jgi:hypothetical protein